MPTQISGTVGPAVASDGSTQVPPRQGRSGEWITTDLHGRYYEATKRGNLYIAYCVAQATSVVGTAMVGLQLWNPSVPGSVGAVDLVLLKCSVMIVVTSASVTSLVLSFGTGQVNAPTGQTPATKVANGYLQAVSNPKGLALAGGTFANAPVAIRNLLHNTAAIAAAGEDTAEQVDFEGSIIVPPQTYVAIAAVGAAVAASGSNLDLSWEEVPI